MHEDYTEPATITCPNCDNAVPFDLAETRYRPVMIVLCHHCGWITTGKRAVAQWAEEGASQADAADFNRIP